MTFKNFSISVTKSLIALVVVTLIFSTVTLDFPNLIKDVFGDIFAYASPEAQKQVISKLAETCLQIESGELERACDELSKKDSLLPDFSNIGAFEKYSKAMNYLNDNKIIYFVILAVLLVLLYLLIMGIKLFLLTLTAISFSIGILIMLPYIAILAYENFIGIDTTPLLSSIFGGGIGIEPKAIISVILLLFLRTYTPTIIVLGIVFLAIGAAGKNRKEKSRI